MKRIVLLLAIVAVMVVGTRTAPAIDTVPLPERTARLVEREPARLILPIIGGLRLPLLLVRR